MEILHTLYGFVVNIIVSLNKIFWGDLFTLSFNEGATEFGLSILVLILIPAGLYFTIRSRFLPFRLFPEMLRVARHEYVHTDAGEGAISGVQALIVATASRVGMGNLAGVVAAISVGGPGAVFWMWVSALIGSASAFVESTLAQMYKEKDPLYGGYRGGPAYFMKHGCGAHVLGILFALSGLLCWAGISQVIANSVTTAFHHAFGIPQLHTTIALVLISGCIVLRKNATVKVLSKTVPFVACAYLVATIFIFCKNIALVPDMLHNIFSQALGIRQFLGGGLGVVIMNGVKRGLFSNEAGSGSAPCAAAAASVVHPVSQGLIQSLGVFIDTLVICSCSAFVMLLAPPSVTHGHTGMAILQAAMNYHLGGFGSVFVAMIIFLLSFSNVAGILFYARGNVAYLFGDTWRAQTGYKLFALVMLFMGGIAAYEIVWELGDLGVALMTIFNMLAVLPLSGQAFGALRDYEAKFLAPRPAPEETI